MKLSYALTALALFSSLNAQAATLSSCKTAVASSAARLTEANELFRVGAYTLADVAAVKVSDLNVRFECRAISFDDYCAEAVPAAKILFEQVVEEARVGSKTGRDILTAKAQFAQATALCK